MRLLRAVLFGVFGKGQVAGFAPSSEHDPGPAVSHRSPRGDQVHGIRPSTMAMTSPRIESPLNASRNSKTIPSYTSPPRFYSELPLQESVSSASPIPASPRVSSISALLPTPQYIDQIKAVIEQQRQLHEKERALWITETHALQDKVAQLEASLRRYQERNGDSGVIFPLDDRSGTTFGTFGGFPLATASKSTTASTGNEFWRGAGGKSDAVPTRTFSDPTSSRPKPENKQMPSIPEDAISYHPGRALSADTTIAALPRQHPPLNQTIDGIIFKPTTLSLPTTKPALPLDESPSPSHSSPPAPSAAPSTSALTHSIPHPTTPTSKTQVTRPAPAALCPPPSTAL
ncbi:MAG: hypothetical protein FRX48_04791 [Lasallia pustulata]|uniref:Uncharacterized protein n=1 Tax=Lasallia pustulata TaxID=136370 RepID=A0A5M8PSD2_9LECA|nr:MAG: hypothetical protein FRX48_04791 [Lasallia pustulata]